jgi:hypothetical protein
MNLRSFIIIALAGLVFIIGISTVSYLAQPDPAQLTQTQPQPQIELPTELTGKHILVFGLSLAFLTVIGYLLFLREPSPPPPPKLTNHPTPKYHRA